MAAIEDDLSANAARIAELEEEAAAKEKVMGEQRSACTGTEMMHEELDRHVHIDAYNHITVYKPYWLNTDPWSYECRQRVEMEARIRKMEEQIREDNTKTIRTKQMIEEQRKAIEDLALKLSDVEARRVASEKMLKDVTRALISSQKKSADMERRCYDEQVRA